jgi:hypothetical protein
MIAILAVSPNLVSYSYLLALLPTVLLMSEMPRRRWVWPLAAYLLLAGAFPWKAALLVAYFIAVGWDELRQARGGYALTGAAVVSVAVAFAGGPPMQFARVGSHPGEVYVNRPAVSRAGMAYETMTRDRYSVVAGGRTIPFEGDAFHPTMTDSGAVYFEGDGRILRSDDAAAPPVVERGEEPAVSRDGLKLAFESGGIVYMRVGGTLRQIARGHDPSLSADGQLLLVSEGAGRWSLTNGSASLLSDVSPLASPSLSDDGRTLAFAARRGWNWQVWTKNLATGAERRITDGDCNNDHPVWEPGSHAIVFASDCGRGFGMPALFRADIGN